MEVRLVSVIDDYTTSIKITMFVQELDINEHHKAVSVVLGNLSCNLRSLCVGMASCAMTSMDLTYLKRS